MGFGNVPFLTQAWPAIMVLAVIDIWQWTPFVTLLMLAGLQSLPQEVFEAARVDDIGRGGGSGGSPSRCSCRCPSPSCSSG
jgi:ABC-type sugar transport system permease subunit